VALESRALGGLRELAIAKRCHFSKGDEVRKWAKGGKR
jgi:hypothetical protein